MLFYILKILTVSLIYSFIISLETDKLIHIVQLVLQKEQYLFDYSPVLLFIDRKRTVQ